MWGDTEDFEAKLLSEEYIDNIASEDPWFFWPKVNEPLPYHIIQALVSGREEIIADNIQQVSYRKPYRQGRFRLCSDRSLLCMLLDDKYEEGAREEFDNMVNNQNLVALLDVPVHTFVTFENDESKFAFCEGLDRGSVESMACLNDTGEAEWYKHLVRPYLNLIKTLHESLYTHGDITDTNVVFSRKFDQLYFIDFERLIVHERDEAGHLSHDWKVQRLVDIYDMCNSIMTHSSDEDTEMNPNRDVIAFLEEIRDSLDEYEFYTGGTPTEEAIEKYEYLTIDYITQEIEKAMENQWGQTPLI